MGRESVLWLGLAIAIVTYLSSAAKPPIDWSYAEWIQFASFVLAWISGKLADPKFTGSK